MGELRIRTPEDDYSSVRNHQGLGRESRFSYKGFTFGT